MARFAGPSRPGVAEHIQLAALVVEYVQHAPVVLIEAAFVVEYVQSDAPVVFEYVQQALVTYAPPVICAAPQPATEGTQYIWDLNPYLHPSPDLCLQIYHGTKQLPREDDGEQYEYGMWRLK